MNRRLRTTALALLVMGLLAVVAKGQPPVSERVSPEELKRVGTWFKAIQGQQMDPKLLEQLQQLVKNNPQLQQNPGELAKQFLEKNPKLLTDPKQLGQLQQLAQQLNQGQSGNTPVPKLSPQQLPTPPMPPTPPGQTQPMPRQPPGQLQLPKNPQSQVGNPPKMPTPVGGPQPMDPGKRQAQNGSGQGTAPPVNSQQFQKVAGWWEQNIGSLKETPGVQQVLAEVLQSANRDGDASWLSQAFKDADPSKGLDNSTLSKIGESLQNVNGPDIKNLGLGNWLNGWGDTFRNLNPPNVAPPSGMNLPDVGNLPAAGAFSSVLLLPALAALALFVWWFWPKLSLWKHDRPQSLPGLGPWPVNPRDIADRESLVKAFEYLSVLLCGQTAMSWNHVTIANRLREAVPNSEPIAEPLARAYALARYTPSDSPLPDSLIQEARGYLCQLAGVSP